jgi:sarcosine oxidase subunit gamma
MREIRPGLELLERRSEALVELVAWRHASMQAHSLLGRLCGLAPPSEQGRCSFDDGTVIMYIGPGRFMVETADAGLHAALRLALAGDEATVTDLTDSRSCIRLSGERSTWTLRKGLPVDLDVSVFGPSDVIQSSILHMDVIARRIGADAFDIYVSRSYAVTFVEWLTDVARDCRERVPDVPVSVRSP